MVDFMKWALTDGQKFAAELGYAPLPEDGRRAGDDGAREDQGAVDVEVPAIAFVATRLGFRVGTGVFGSLLIVHRRRRSASS